MQFDGQAVTIEDFLTIAASVTNTDLEQFKLWYDQSGTPQLNVSDNFIDGTYSLTIEQHHQKSAKDFYIPLAFGLLTPEGTSTPTEVLLVNKDKQIFSFTDLPTKPITSLLRNFSAPIKIQYAQSNENLQLLICHDNDPINRREASQKLMTNIIIKLINDKTADKSCALPPILTQTFANVLNDSQIDSSLAAEILQLPTENYLLETLDAIEIETLHFVCEFIKTEVALHLKNELLSCYQNNNRKQPYNIEAASIGRRELKNCVLHYLTYLNTREVDAICLAQLEQSDNLTDTMAALVALANSNYAHREELLEEYYKKWQEQPNLVNKWLTINANIKTSNTLQRVKKLLSHPSFNIKNPNNVLSLIRTFCENNHPNFHAADGSGYQFLSEQILIIDKFNPQLAALITPPLTRGHKLDKSRQDLLQQQLIKINQTPGLSNNVYEIVTKALI